jgi:hypothetical protein
MYQVRPGAAAVKTAISAGVRRVRIGFTDMNGIFVVPGGAVLGSGLYSMNQLRPSVFIRYPAPDPPDMTPNLLEMGIDMEVGVGGRTIIGAGVDVGLGVAVGVGDEVAIGVDVGVIVGVTSGLAEFGISVAVGTGVGFISGMWGVDVGVVNRGVGTGIGTGAAVGVADIGVEVGVGIGPLSTGVGIGPDVISTLDGPGPGIRTEVAVGACVGDASGWTTGDAVERGSSSPPPHPVIAMIVAASVTIRVVTFVGARPVPSRVKKPLNPFIGD